MQNYTSIVIIILTDRIHFIDKASFVNLCIINTHYMINSKVTIADDLIKVQESFYAINHCNCKTHGLIIVIILKHQIR